ncbi:MAG: hypothetical protein JWN04_4053, partial [Myxococcaceae bacterium]|nr:hypothetical protein [Myxococcaceae bacterium]
MPPNGERVPSGNTSTENPSARRARTASSTLIPAIKLPSPAATWPHDR